MQSSQQIVETRPVLIGQVLGRIRRYRRIDRLITDWETTPGKLRATRVVLVIGILLAGGIGVYAANARVDISHSIVEYLGPLNANVTTMYRSLADADATVAAGFLSGRVEPSQVRARYDQDVGLAAVSLAQAATQAGGEQATANQITDITIQLPVYTGLVERARANNRQGLAVGVAYLRLASDQMRNRILPRAAELQRRQAARLDDAYQRAGSVPIIALVACGVSLAGLIWAQWFLFQRTHRVFNIGLVAASGAVLVGLVWWTGAGAASASALTSSHGHSESAFDGLGPAQIAALQARAIESLELVTRTGGDTESMFEARMQQLALNNGGALDVARQFATDPEGRALVQAAVDDARSYATTHKEVRRLDDVGEYTKAVDAAVSTAETSAATAFDRLDKALNGAGDHERGVLKTDMVRAQSWLNGLAIGTGGLALAAVVGVALGVRQRLEEYR